MIISMTGYGKGQAYRDGIGLTTDVRALNSRYLDLQLRLPKELQFLEPVIRKSAQELLVRGNVTITASLEENESVLPPLKFNRARLIQYRSLLKEMRDELDLDEGDSLSEYLRFDDIIHFEEVDRDDIYRELMTDSLGDALNEVTAMRRSEGSNLTADIEGRIQSLADTLDSVTSVAFERRQGDFERYKTRLQDLLTDLSVDENRILQEAAIITERKDITEECTRLQSHLDLFRQYLYDGDAAGKKLGFLLQEMGREINTMGSKTDHVEISHDVVKMKHELEKIREQIQNVL